MAIKWFGDKVKAGIEKAFMDGVNESNHRNFVDIKADWPVLTGFSKSQLKEVEAIRDGDEVFALVAANADYSAFIELDKKPMRRNSMANENSSLENFNGTLK